MFTRQCLGHTELCQITTNTSHHWLISEESVQVRNCSLVHIYQRKQLKYIFNPFLFAISLLNLWKYLTTTNFEDFSDIFCRFEPVLISLMCKITREICVYFCLSPSCTVSPHWPSRSSIKTLNTSPDLGLTSSAGCKQVMMNENWNHD